MENERSSWENKLGVNTGYEIYFRIEHYDNEEQGSKKNNALLRIPPEKWWEWREREELMSSLRF